MKKNIIFMAVAALVLAASCSKEPANAPVGTETITVNLNTPTRTEMSGTKTVWLSGDAVSVTVDGTQIGVLELVEGNVFRGEIEKGYDGVATLNYPAGATSVPTTQNAVEGSFADEAALLEGTTTVADLRAGNGAMLNNKTALLSFATPVAGDVAFTIGNVTYTVKGCSANKTYYACVDPAQSGKMSYTVGIVLGDKTKESFSTEAGKFYELGTLALKQSMFAVVGDCNSWTDAKMYETSQDNVFVLYGATFASTGGFKIRKAGAWEDSYNFGTTSNTSRSKNAVVGVYADGNSSDIKVNAGTYDIYFERLAGRVYLMESGKSYTTATKPTNTLQYCLIGSFNNWSDVDMTYSGDGIWTIVYKLAANNEFKIRKKGTWNENWGYDNMSAGKNLTSNSGGNVKVNSAGDYVIGFYKAGNKISLVKK